MKLRVYEYDMKLKYPFSISRHTYLSQPNIILELEHEGKKGYGEATLNPYYNITIENLKESFGEMMPLLEKYPFSTPDQLFMDFSGFLTKNSFALAALNNASWDLFGKMRNCPVGELIDIKKSENPITSYTLGIAEEAELGTKIRELPWPIYKIKLGTSNDLELINYIRKHTKSIIRVDANCAWTLEQTVALSKEFEKLGVEFIEQPLPANNPDQENCYKSSLLPLMADESCCVEIDVEKCADKFDAINIKLLKCGGLSPAIRMIKKARKLGLKIMIGCMTESSVGMSAAAQLLPYVDYADLDGPLLLAEDIAEGLTYDYGKLNLSDQNGLGISFIGKN